MKPERSSFPAHRCAVIATAAVFIFTLAEPPMAAARPLTPASERMSAATASSDATDFSAARRRRYVRRGGNAAGIAFFGMALGTIGAIAAQQQRNDYYDNRYNYGYGQGYYGGDPYYGRRYYRRY